MKRKFRNEFDFWGPCPCLHGIAQKHAAEPHARTKHIPQKIKQLQIHSARKKY